jgi:hypothetical protein
VRQMPASMTSVGLQGCSVEVGHQYRVPALTGLAAIATCSLTSGLELCLSLCHSLCVCVCARCGSYHALSGQLLSSCCVDHAQHQQLAKCMVLY